MSTPAPSGSAGNKQKLTLITIAALCVGAVCYMAFGTSNRTGQDVESAATVQYVSAVSGHDKNTPNKTLAAEPNVGISNNDFIENTKANNQVLKEVLPDNDPIPFERTPAEVETMMAEFQEHSALQKKIEAGDATEEDQLRFYALRASKLEYEIGIIKLCQDVQGNQLDAGEEKTAPNLCANATAKGSQRLQQLEEMLADLEQKYL